MAIRRFKIDKQDLFTDMAEQIKNIIETNYPNVFDTVLYQDNSSYYHTWCSGQKKISFIKNEETLFTLETVDTDGYYYGLYMKNPCVTNSMYYGNIVGSGNSSDVNPQCTLYHKYISEIICINNTTFAFSFRRWENDSNECYLPGIVIFTLTDNGDVAMIRPNSAYNTHKKNTVSYTSDPIYNYLECATKESTGTDFSYKNIFFESALGLYTVISPIMVYSTNDYCPTCFWVSSSQFLLDDHTDAIIEIEGIQFYYNGFIVVQLDQ